MNEDDKKKEEEIDETTRAKIVSDSLKKAFNPDESFMQKIKRRWKEITEED